MTYIDGKLCFINQTILGVKGPRALQRMPVAFRPVVAGGDATTDVTMVRDAKGVHVVLNRNKDELIASFRITFDRQNNISRFDVKEAQGQWSEFTLSSFNRKPVLKGNEFVFKIPKGVELDDQR